MQNIHRKRIRLNEWKHKALSGYIVVLILYTLFIYPYIHTYIYKEPESVPNKYVDYRLFWFFKNTFTCVLKVASEGAVFIS